MQKITFLQTTKPYFVYLASWFWLSIIFWALFSEPGGTVIKDFENWAFKQFLKSTLILVPVCAISVYISLKFGKLRVLYLAVLTAVVHILGFFYINWILSQLAPGQDLWQTIIGVVDTKLWPYPIWNFIRDLVVVVLCLVVVRHLKRHLGRTPKGTA